MPEKSSKGLHDQIGSPSQYVPPDKIPGAMPQVPEELLKKADKLKEELEDFKKKLVKKFPFVHFLSVLPANSFKNFEEDEGLLPEEVAKKPLHIMMLIPEDQFKNIQKKIKPDVLKLAKETKQELWVHIKTEIDLWNYGLDSKYEFIDAIASSFPLYDKGLLGSLRLANIHKSLVLRKFEKYVASYVVGGSLVRGTADKTSDVDTFVIIDDTDVKRMPRLQLLEKLRGMIHDYIREATALSGTKNILNVQVYLLTDFWDNVKDANPVMFTFIRDGVPMYDRGTFLPWKLLLQMGKVKPSPEAVDKFMKYGEQNEGLVTRRMLDAMIDIYWGVVTPTQALMMLSGHAPPAPKTMVQDVQKV
ncbi:MAG: nucleotidyltransferase domain-containing protein, partial [Nanoarchaeota archaeon]